VLTALPVVQSFRRERYEDGRFREATQKTLKAYFRALAAQLKFRLTVNAATTIGRAAIMILGGYRVLQGELTIGGLLVFLAYLGSLYEPLETLAHMTAGVASAEASAKRVLDVLDTQDHVPSALVATESPKGPWRGLVRFERVSFAYEPGHPVLCEVDFVAKPGEVVAIVGHTGAGKSTMMSLLLRLFDPCSGRITLDGADLRDIPLPEVRAQIGILLQEPFLLPVSIAENIAYGRPDASHEEIVAAAAAARADEFIRQLPDGYETTVGERGMTLSGGQKQRIAIARALLKNAPVIILDEPTSALDARTEWQVINEVRPLLAERTVFVIAHRLSTIRHADRVVVMQAGRIVQEGHHSELVAREGVYREMYREHSVELRRVATS
jgi:ATP-binding cassette subfamily B protein/subfamily B ATP-binding cassette protein MsbA